MDSKYGGRRCQLLAVWPSAEGFGSRDLGFIGVLGICVFMVLVFLGFMWCLGFMGFRGFRVSDLGFRV